MPAVQSGYMGVTQQNNINQTLAGAFDNTLSLDGTGPNQLGANLDLGGNSIINLGPPTSNQSPVRVEDMPGYANNVVGSILSQSGVTLTPGFDYGVQTHLGYVYTYLPLLSSVPPGCCIWLSDIDGMAATHNIGILTTGSDKIAWGGSLQNQFTSAFNGTLLKFQANPAQSYWRLFIVLG